MSVTQLVGPRFGTCKMGLHGACRGHHYNPTVPTVRDKKGEVLQRGRHTLCGCSCHAGQPLRCLVCRQADVELDDRGQCVNEEACYDEAQRRLQAEPRWRALRQARADVDAIIAARELAASNGFGQTKPARVRVEKPTSGRCEHCGEPTKGGRFVAGHDAKLKGDLKRAAEAGDLDALVELLARGWPTHRVKVDNAVMDQALTVHDRSNGEWLPARVAQRIGES